MTDMKSAMLGHTPLSPSPPPSSNPSSPVQTNPVNPHGIDNILNRRTALSMPSAVSPTTDRTVESLSNISRFGLNPNPYINQVKKNIINEKMSRFFLSIKSLWNTHFAFKINFRKKTSVWKKCYFLIWILFSSLAFYFRVLAEENFLSWPRINEQPCTGQEYKET